MKPTILCISTYEKGQAFLREAARLGVDVVLLTVDKLENGDWPRESLKHLLTMPEGLSAEQTLGRVMLFAREAKFHRVVPLDEFDLETAALIREYMRLPGMGQTPTYLFRDKLAMREAAKRAGVPVPEFTPVFHRADVGSYLGSVPGPWLLKPRTSASAIGIHRIDSAEQLWRTLDDLGDRQTDYLLERFVPGDIFHVEGITSEAHLLFEAPFGYGQPPMETMHQGGVFTTRLLDRSSPEAIALRRIHADVLAALGMISGVTHTEFIRSRADGSFFFLETAARVGGAYIAETVEFATGINPWVEWARLECAPLLGHRYLLPEVRQDYSGSIICLARQQDPDTSAFTDPEIVYRLHKHHHAGIIVRSDSPARVESLVHSYRDRFLADFYASMPAPDKPTA